MEERLKLNEKYPTEHFLNTIWPGICAKLTAKDSEYLYLLEVKRICSYLDKEFSAISKMDAEKYDQYQLEQMNAKKVSRNTIYSRYAVLNAIAEWYIQNMDGLYVNPYSDKLVQYKNVYISPASVPSMDAIEEIMYTTYEDMRMNMMLLLVEVSGATTSELIELKRENIYRTTEGIICVQIGKKTKLRFVEIPIEQSEMVEEFCEHVDPSAPLLRSNRNAKKLDARSLQYIFRCSMNEQFEGRYKFSLKDLRNASIARKFAAASSKEERRNIIETMGVPEKWGYRYDRIVEVYRKK